MDIMIWPLQSHFELKVCNMSAMFQKCRFKVRVRVQLGIVYILFCTFSLVRVFTCYCVMMHDYHQSLSYEVIIAPADSNYFKKLKKGSLCPMPDLR